MQNLQVVEVRGLRVLTSNQIANLYGTIQDRIKQNFQTNRKRYLEGKHYISITGEELRAFKNRGGNSALVGKTANILFLWTEKGALLHAKSLNTDKAWEVYDYLVDFYFQAKEKQKSEKKEVVTVTVSTKPIADELQNKKPLFSGFTPAKGIMVNIPENKEAQELISEMRKYIVGMDALLDVYSMYRKEEDFCKIQYAVSAMEGKISRTAHFLQFLKPGLIEKYL